MEKTCAQCQASFEVADEDLAFYDRVSPVIGERTFPVPPPTLCPDCRLQRRLSWRNDRKLYKRKDDFTGKNLISMFAPDSPIQVMHKDDWFSDNWNPLDYGLDYDFNRPFFDQFHDLLLRVPRAHLITVKTENAEYTNYNSGNKNCYLCFAGNYTEDSYYCYNAEMSKDCCDCHYVFKCELCYECVQCEHCYNTHYSLHSTSCTDSWFLEDCSECKDCLLCWNLHRKQYCILNQQYTKEEYQKLLHEYNLHTYDGVQSALETWSASRFSYPKRAIRNRMTEECEGEYLTECHNCKTSFNVGKGCQDCKNIFMGFPELKDAYDCTFSGEHSSHMYECIASGEDCNNMLFGNICVVSSSDLLYCDCLFHSSHCFGCTCLNKKEYCILNKQYTKEEYNSLVPKIIEHMQSTGEWGEFFPAKHSIFAYNESHAFEYYPLAQNEVESKGWQWREEVQEVPETDKIIPGNQLPDSIDEIPDDVLNWAISCTKTGRPFRIVQQELAYHRKLSIPLPTTHPDIRHQRRVQLRNSHHLFTNSCQKCSSQVKTPYSPDGLEIVYCEKCYLSEVY